MPVDPEAFQRAADAEWEANRPKHDMRYWRDGVLLVSVFILTIPFMALAAIAHTIWRSLEVGWSIGEMFHDWTLFRLEELTTIDRQRRKP